MKHIGNASFALAIWEVTKLIDRDAVREQIERILRSSSFADKSQLKTLLEVLFKNMDSQTTLKPDRVIQELWPQETRTKGSADVATEIARLRKGLESYYSTEGRNDPIRITLPNRSTPGSGGIRERRWIVAEAQVPVHDPLTTGLVAQDSLAQNYRISRWRGIRKPILISTAIVIAGIGTLFAIHLLSADTIPQSARLDGTTLQVLNAQGNPLWRANFPDGFWHDYYEQGVQTRMWFGDLDGMGRTEVLFLYHTASNPTSHSTTLICYSDRGKEKWRWTAGRALPELNGSPAVFVTVDFDVLKANKAGPRRIVVSSRNEPFYPHQIAIVDSNGKTVSEYWHTGILFHTAIADLDGDGKQEIVASGISNGYRQATLIALDPDHASGASTESARPEVQIHGMDLPHERFRLLFPRSDLNQTLSIYNVGQDITIDQGRIRVLIRECTIIPRCFILYEFDKNLQLRSVMPDDQFRSAHKEFYLSRKDNHPFTPKEESQFQKIRCLVGCNTDFVPVNVQ